MKRRGSRAAAVWLVGDRLYYLGLLTAIVGTIIVFAVAAVLHYSTWVRLFASAATLIGGAAMFLLGSSLKARSYAIAESDGIDISSY